MSRGLSAGHGGSNSGHGNSASNGLSDSGAGPGRLLIDGSLLDGHGEHWWHLA